MSVSFDAASTIQTYAGASSKSWTHTNSGTTDLCAVVAVGTAILTANFSSPTCTYAGAAMTATVSHEGVGFNLVRAEAKLFHLANPTTGAQTVAVTWATGSVFGEGGSLTYLGVNQASPIGNTGTADGTSTTTSSPSNGSDTIASATGNMVVDDLIVDFGVNTITGSQTERFKQSAVNTYDGGTQDAPGAASVAMTWTLSVSDQWTWCGAELVASGAAAGRLFRTPLLNGLGSGGPLYNNPLG